MVINLVPAILTGIQRLSPNDIGRQVANTHTFFAIFAVLALLPVSGWIVKLSQKLLPPLPSEQRLMESQKLVYLANAEKNVPAVAMKQAQLEVNRMGKLARDNLADALKFFFNPTDAELHQKIVETEQTIDFLNHAIEDKLVELRALSLPDKDVFRLSRMILVVSNIERIGDHAENIMEFGDRMVKEKAVISETALKELRTMGDATLETIDVSLVVFQQERFDLLPRAEALEQRVDDMQEQYIQNHVERLMGDTCDPLGGVIFTDMCTDLERCSDQGINIATALNAKH